MISDNSGRNGFLLIDETYFKIIQANTNSKKTPNKNQKIMTNQNSNGSNKIETLAFDDTFCLTWSGVTVWLAPIFQYT